MPSPRTRRRWRALGSLSLVAFCLTFLRAEMCPPKAVTDPDAVIVRVTMDPVILELAPGATSQIIARARDEANRVIDDREFTWRSSNPAVVSVAPEGGRAVITGVAAGTATIVATVDGVEGETSVTVKAPTTPVERIIVNNTNATMRVQDSISIAAAAADAGNNLLEGRVYEWSVADPSVVRLHPLASGQAGFVGLKEGSTAFTVTSGGKSASGTITVTGGPAPKSIRASTDTVKVTVGAAASVTLTAHDRLGGALPDTVMAVAIANTGTARFTTPTTTATGRAPVSVTGVAVGTTTLTASIGTVTLQVPVVVSAAPVAPDSLVVRPLGVFTVKRLANGSTETFSGMQFAGDHEANGDKSMQAFASFIFESLPTTATLSRAMLTLTLDAEAEGTPFALGALVAELAESSTLNEGALSTTAIALTSAATPRTVTVDVAPFINSARAAGRISVTLRFRFTQLGNNNSKVDYIGFASDPLTIHYTRAASVQAPK